MPDFTQNQQQAITVTDRNLLVSAGAGAGKTSTLIERLYNIIATPGKCPIDDVLVVTFTRAAAQEMRTRLQKRLTEALLKAPEESADREWLQDQLLAVPRANISTIHSFCLQTITEHGDKIGLSPAFQLISEGEQILEQREFLRNKLDALMEANGEAAAHVKKLLRLYKPTSAVETLLGWVVEFHAFLDSLPDPKGWIAEKTGRDYWTSRPDARAQLNKLMIVGYLTPVFSLLEQALAVDNGDFAEHTLANRCDVLALTQKLEGLLRQEPFPSTETLIASLTLPRAKHARNHEPTEAESRFGDLRKALLEKLSNCRKALEPLTVENERPLDEATVATLALFAGEMGYQWHTDLFDERVKGGRLTFGHLERLAHRLLTKDGQPSELALQYRTQFQHVFVDEFQDVNELQNSILRAVAREPQEGRGGNLFVVGDLKQSIYEFRQAEPTLFMRLYNASVECREESSPELQARLSFQHNFRSDARLLETFNDLFGRLMTPETLGIDYEGEHALIPGRTVSAEQRRENAFTLTLLPQEKELPSEWQEYVSLEAAYVAKLVREIGPPWREICILTRTAKGRIPDLYEALQQAGIPVYTSNRTGFLTAIEVVEFQAILSTIDNPWLDLDLLGTLRGPAFRWKDSELLALRGIHRSQPFFQNLLGAAANEASGLHAKANEVLSALSRWQELSTHVPMRELFVRLYDELDLLEIASVRPGGEQRRRNLEALLDRAAEFDGFQRKGLSRFLEFLEQLIDEGKDLATPSVIPEDADMVQIMTIHASKGMEFPIVILPFTGVRFNSSAQQRAFLWDREAGIATNLGVSGDSDEGETTAPSDADGDGFGIDAAVNLTSYMRLRAERRRRETCEELRLLYVALTRAREAVHIVGSVDEKARASMAETPNAFLAPNRVLRAHSFIEWLLPWLKQSTLLGTDGSIATLEELSAGEELMEWPAENRRLAPLLRPGSASEAITGRLARRTWFSTAGDANQSAGDQPMETAAMPQPDEHHRQALKRVQINATRTPPPLLRAKLSVTEAKRVWQAQRDAETPPFEARNATQAQPSIDWIPARMLGPNPVVENAGPVVGNITHRFLANMKLHDLGNTLGLRAEARRQIEAGLLTAEEERLVPLKEIAWFFGTPVGIRLLSLQGNLHRERPFIAAVHGESLHPGAAGRTMILQGILDVLYRDADGWVIVDYKTDSVTSRERLANLIESYSVQMRLYMLLVEEALGEPVKGAWLVFLRANELVEVRKDSVPIKWEEVLAAGAVIFPETAEATPAIRYV